MLQPKGKIPSHWLELPELAQEKPEEWGDGGSRQERARGRVLCRSCVPSCPHSCTKKKSPFAFLEPHLSCIHV